MSSSDQGTIAGGQPLPTEDRAGLARRGPAAALEADFAEAAKILFSAGSVTETLNRVVDLAVASIDGCDHAGIFVIKGGAVTNPAERDPVVTAVDSLQQLIGEGPCLDALRQDRVYYAEDLADDVRWPLFGPRAAEVGIRSLLALHLSAADTSGALNLYARYPSAFGAIDRAKALVLAVLAGLALSTAQDHADETDRRDNLQAALVTRELIGQAEGILMERERITADQAFDILRRASQHLNVKLRDIAQNLVDTGEDPNVGQGAAPVRPSRSAQDEAAQAGK